MKIFWVLILAVFASEKAIEDGQEPEEEIEENVFLVKIEEDEYVKVSKKSKFIGVSYNKNSSKWKVQRWSKSENKNVSNGYYVDEETAAHASDTLARKLMDNGEQNHKLNFPYEDNEVYKEEKSSKFIGVSYNKNRSKWKVQRRNESKMFCNGHYDDEETAAHASDTLARKIMENGEQKLKLNFPGDHTEVHPERTAPSKYIGVCYYKNKSSKWRAQRWSKNESKKMSYGYYNDEETAAHASDTLARKLMENGEPCHKLNFPDDYIEIYREKNQKKKRKRPKILILENPQIN